MKHVVNAALTAQEHERAVSIVRDCAAGELRIKARGEAYLPKHEGMTARAYQAWLKRVTYLPVVASTLAAIMGRIERKPPIVTFPDERQPFFANGQRYGWAWGIRTILNEVLSVGRLLAVADVDTAKLNETRLLTYRAEEIVDTREENGVLVSVKVADSSCDDGEMIEHAINDDGKNDDGKYEVRRLNKNGAVLSVSFPAILGKPLDFIPAVFFNPSSLSACPEQPPMLDLALRSLAFYVLAAEHRQAMYWCASPQPVATGFSKEELPKLLGPSTILSSRNPGAKFQFVTFSGDGLSEMRAALTELKMEMASLGAGMLLPKNSSNVAARTVELRQREDASIAVTAISTVQDGLQRLAQMMLQWEQRSGDVSFNINTDLIDAQMSHEMLKALRDAYLSGTISFTTWIEQLQRGEVIPITRSADDERNLIDTDPHMLGAEQ